MNRKKEEEEEKKYLQAIKDFYRLKLQSQWHGELYFKLEGGKVVHAWQKKSIKEVIFKKGV